MAAANVNLLKTRGSYLLCYYNHNTTLTHHTPRLFLPFSLLSSSKPKFLSLLSSTPSLPSPISRRHFRYLCTAPDAPTSSSTSTSTAIDASSANASPPPQMQSAESVKDAASSLDIRVGKVLKAWRHPDADSLYVEEVDIGEEETRTICSGLVKYLPLDHLQDKKVIVLANLKPRNMRGVKSYGMLMAASDASHENVELLVPPEESVLGERVWFGSEEEKENQPAAATPNQVQKKKIWESVQPHLKTDASCIAMLDEHYMRTSAGPVVSKSLKNANIS